MMQQPMQPAPPSRQIEVSLTSDKDDDSVLSGSSFDSSDSDDSSKSEEGEDKIIEGTSHSIVASRIFQIWVVSGPVIIFVFVLITTILGFIYVSNKRLIDNEDNRFKLVVGFLRDASLFQANIFHETFAELSEKITSHAVMSHSVWPFVTYPFFDLTAKHIQNISNAEFISYSPIVTSPFELAWDKYAIEEEWWTPYEQKELNNKNNSVIEHVNASTHIYSFHDQNQSKTVAHSFIEGLHAPFWQMFPVPSNRALSSFINFDILSIPEYVELYRVMEINMASVTSKAILSDSMYLGDMSRDGQKFYNTLSTFFETPEKAQEVLRLPHSIYLYPIFKDIQKNNYHESRIVGFLQGIISWEKYLAKLNERRSVEDLHYVLWNTCGQTFTFLHTKEGVTYLGRGDRHNTYYHSPSDTIENLLLATTSTSIVSVTDKSNNNNDEDNKNNNDNYNYIPTTGCRYSLNMYPVNDEAANANNWGAGKFAILVATPFAMMILVFYTYHHFILRWTDKVLKTAENSNKMIESIFPASFHERLFGSSAAGSDAEVLDDSRHSHITLPKMGKMGGSGTPSAKLKSYLKENDWASESGGFDDGSVFVNDKPIADLFPNATVMFADIVGFTAWSSMREPTQVFTLLETIFGAYDSIALRRNVYKVETIGDCYVAVCGLPDPREDHAVVMAQFSWECMIVMHDLTKKLEATLGPDTGELSMRFGIHSGPVTAGVLRGERARFQLFGETVNTVSWIESTGQRGRIHTSADTAKLIIDAGHHQWVKLRDDKVKAKGKKGELTTYWLTMGERIMYDEHGHVRNVMPTADSKKAFFGNELGYEENALAKMAAEKEGRLIDFNVEILQLLLKQIVARRRAKRSFKPTFRDAAKAAYVAPKNVTVLEEVKEVVYLPKFDPKAAKMQEDPELITLDSAVILQLRDYVTSIASMYNSNPFHNFEHASHVIMSVVKLLTRIVAPKGDFDYSDSDGTNERPIEANPGNNPKKIHKSMAYKLHDHTYGITSDPLTQFAVVFSALIHDVDHTGVPNVQLAVEKPDLAATYKNKSIAEQNSVDLAWDLLMRPCYNDLCRVICSSEAEWMHFRQLVVNTVMATDIVDKELKEIRNARWDKAFKSVSQSQVEEDLNTDINRKATIVIEHLIQASDVSHTMQHWHIYKKWNEKFFYENYKAYKEGRLENDPSVGWYKGEIGFFDFYIIPLTKKLKNCGVFGVSSDEYLNYALKNREEWEQKGESVVAEFLAEAKKHVEEDWKRFK